jgi:predicted short-subunit dehydrogenase-like oxidoreductase (DUF2520 family)
MESYYNIAFVGAGNLAWHLAPAIENFGHKVSLVSSRTKKNGRSLIDRLYNASLKRGLNFSKSNVDAIIVAVNDDNIREVIQELIIPENCTVIHTSGTQPIEILEMSAAAHYGILYPLQTFTKGIKVDLRESPVFVEANDNFTYRILHNLTKGLFREIYKISSEQRMVLHLGGVIGANFSNHMLTIAKSLMDEHDMDYRLLQNLVYRMFHKAFEIGPENGQTGPAIRGDHDTMQKHLKLLKDDPDLKKIYALISNHIIKTYQE